MMYFKNKYKDSIRKNKKLKETVNDFDYILNNMWCAYSFEKGKSKWLMICKDIESPYHRQILTEIGHVEIGHGREQALMALRSEMTKYIDSLI